MIPKEVEDKINDWLGGPVDQETKEEIRLLLNKDPQLLTDSFSKTLTFGTGGMRGLMGVGTNRMNKYTVQMATQGLANYLHTLEAKRDQHFVFISFDTRNHSVEFALEAAHVLAGNDIGVYLTLEPRPTPFVSFGVRQKECTAGIMITASHNPKEYNGYKVYGASGSQVVAPDDVGIVNEVKKIQSFDQIKLSLDKSPLIEIVDLEFDFEYLDAIKNLQVDPKEDKLAGEHLKITYTPLHGCGQMLVPRALKSWNFSNINLVEHQITPDGDFPTVKSPNPENPEALEMGLKQLQDTNGDLLIATDPDADRAAIAILHRNKPYLFNGNQTAAICLEYLCQTLTLQNRLPPNGAAITTIVSTDLIRDIATHYNLAFFTVLTGFKYIGALIDKWIHDRSHTFLFGAEESYGYLIGTHSLDKDAVVMSCLIAEVALLMKAEGRTLFDFLCDIYKKYGFYLERQRVLSFPPGQKGIDAINTLMDKVRSHPPQAILNSPVVDYKDYSEGLDGLPPSNVLAFHLENKSKIHIRPSGTEPKLKIYASIFNPSFTSYEANTKDAEEQLKALFNAIEALF